MLLFREDGVTIVSVKAPQIGRSLNCPGVLRVRRERILAGCQRLQLDFNASVGLSIGRRYVKGAHTPFFLPGHAGNLFALYHRPADPAGCRGGVLYVHPFANEMNYTRRAAALLARALAGRGWGVLQVDLFGCGDSDGDFRDASWETWVDDLATAFGWLQERVGDRVGLVGIRLGGLLALDFASRARRNIDRVLLWHPVVNGQQMMTDFLRLRFLSDAIGERGGESATTPKSCDRKSFW